MFASAGEQNLDPDVVITGGRTFVTWERDGLGDAAAFQVGDPAAWRDRLVPA